LPLFVDFEFNCPAFDILKQIWGIEPRIAVVIVYQAK
jgi:hypothetical protein